MQITTGFWKMRSGDIAEITYASPDVCVGKIKVSSINAESQMTWLNTPGFEGRYRFSSLSRNDLMEQCEAPGERICTRLDPDAKEEDAFCSGLNSPARWTAGTS